MKLKTLQRTVRRLSKTLNCYVSMCLDYSMYIDTGTKEMKYSYYVEFESHRTFSTAQDLNRGMNERIRREKNGSEADEGIEGDV